MKDKQTSSSRLVEFLNGTAQGRSVTLSFVTIGLILLVAFVGIFPALDAIGRQAAVIEQKATVIEQLKVKLQNLAQLTTEQKTKTEVINKLNLKLPDGSAEEEVVVFLDKVVKARGLTLRSVSFNKPDVVAVNPNATSTINPRFKTLVMNVEIEGSAEALQQVVGDIEASRRVININNLFYQRQEATTVNDSAFRLSLRALISYWQPVSGPVAAPSTVITQ